MSSLNKSTHIDRDDFDIDHYADFIRDAHRSRLTLEQLDIAKRQLKRKEKLLTRTHNLKMKEHTRIQNDFLRKLEQDQVLFNLPTVRETLKHQRHQHLETSQVIEEKSSSKHHPSSKISIKPDSPRTEQLKLNIEKFNHTNTIFY